jgi:hypothetical protein
MVLSEPHRKNITSLLWALQVKDLYRFVAIAYQYNYRKSGHYWNALAKVKVTLRPTVSRPVSLGVRHLSGTRDQFFPFSFFHF